MGGKVPWDGRAQVGVAGPCERRKERRGRRAGIRPASHVGRVGAAQARAGGPVRLGLLPSGEGTAFTKDGCLCTWSLSHVGYGLVQATELEGRFGDGNWGPWVEIESPLLPPLAAPQGLSLSHLKSCPLTDLGHSQAYSLASSSP